MSLLFRFSKKKNDNYIKLNREGCLDSLLHIFLMRRIQYAGEGGGGLTGRYYQALIPEKSERHLRPVSVQVC